MSFGKIPLPISFDPTSAFPLDSRCYFESLEEAEAAARTAGLVGSQSTNYYYGMQLLVYSAYRDDWRWYTIQKDRTLAESQSCSVYRFRPDADGAVSDGPSPGLFDDRELDEKSYWVEKAVVLPAGHHLKLGDLLLMDDGRIYRPRSINENWGNPTFRVTLVVDTKAKSAYQYAVDGGFEGTEEEFATKLAELLALTNPDDGEEEDGEGPTPGHASGDLANAVASSLRYTPQNLTDEQKAQARSNIGTMSESEIGELFKKFVTIGTEEPTDGPGFWFDTVNPVEDFPVILQVGDVGSDENDVVIVNVIE